MFSKKYYILAFSLILTSCAVGPNYKEPKTSMPESFTEGNGISYEEVDLKEWWTKFKDQKLNNLIDLAIENNRDLKVAIEKIQQSRAYYNLQKANLYPEVDANAAAIRAKLGDQAGFLVGQNKVNNFFIVGLDASWEIDVFGRLRRLKESARYSLDAQREASRDVYMSLVSEVARIYVDAVALRHKISLIQQKIETLKELYGISNDLYKNGLYDEEPVLNLDSQLKQTSEDLNSLETSYKQDLYRLAILAGQKPEEFKLQVDEQTPIPSAEVIFKINTPSTLLRRRPDIREAERNLASATAQIGAAIAAYFPSFSLFGGSSTASNEVDELFTSGSYVWFFGPTLNWPIINFGRIKANVDTKKSLQRQALYSYEQTVLSALKDVEGALVTYFNGYRNLDLKKQNVMDVSKIHKIVLDQYQNGVKDKAAFLNSKNRLLDIENQFVDNQRNAISNLIALYKAMGGEW